MTTDNGKFRMVRSGDLWVWKYGGWQSQAFPYLEERPWTPILIENIPCFVACDSADLDHPESFAAARWCVVWGDQAGPWFDDVSNLQVYEGRPLYLARREGPAYHGIWGDQISQGFQHQVRLVLRSAGLAAVPLLEHGAQNKGIPLVWRPLEDSPA